MKGTETVFLQANTREWYLEERTWGFFGILISKIEIYRPNNSENDKDFNLEYDDWRFQHKIIVLNFVGAY